MRLCKSLLSNVILKNLGLKPYNYVMDHMQSLAQQKIKSHGVKGAKILPDYLLLCQHNPVYTVGIRSQDYSDEEVINELKQMNAEFIYSDRGGLITFHGPGQLVCYPILNLKNFGLSLRCYVHKLEEVVMETCRKFDVATHRTDDVGIWIGDNKIAAIGVHCKKYVTTHGLALNCDTDLLWFSHIVPCGLVGKSVTSLTQELNKHISVEQTMPVLINSFEEIFKCKVTTEELDDGME